jgi:hypothetical protein
VSDPQTLALIETLREEQRARDLKVDMQLNKIHDLVNSQLTEAVNRFREALRTIEELKRRLGQGQPEGQPASGLLEPTLTPQPAPPPPVLPDPDKTRAQLIAFIDATKAMAMAVMEQGERVTAMLLDRRARSDANERTERRRIFP